MKLALIGNGAIARYVREAALVRGYIVGATMVRADTASNMPDHYVGSVADLPDDTDLVIDCAGHQALATYGPDILSNGTDIITVSIGALADKTLADKLEYAAKQGSSTLHLASGAIGALDCLKAASIGGLSRVTYVGRKPPAGWKGSAAEKMLDLDALTSARTHFEDTARKAALAYPKNANVAAAVALAGSGLDNTQVRLIADPTISHNIHEIQAMGEFGEFHFQISGNSLPDNPRSSALAAMSVLAKLDQLTMPVSL